MIDKPWQRIKVASGHLEFYRQHSISPVNQDLSNLPLHLERRRSLYRCAGLLPAFFRGSDVLEVAPGSGHNSLYIASCLPASYDLCEPNPSAIEGINRLYDNFDMPHTRPDVHPVMLEDFDRTHAYDVVICEGWLGSSAHELTMLEKLAGCAKPGGVLVVTTVSPIGIVPNLLRKLMAQRLISGVEDFEAQTGLLMDAFSSHLSTLTDMSRPHRDWVQDNLLNPAYYGICLTPALVVDQIGKDFSFYGTAPRIISDWRWHKSLSKEQTRYNAHFLDAYYKCAHNFIDHTALLAPRTIDENRQLESECWSLVAEGSEWEQTGCGDIASLVAVIGRIGDDVGLFSTAAKDAIDEFLTLFRDPNVDARDVADMKLFSHLFGRENLYVSLCLDGKEA